MCRSRSVLRTNHVRASRWHRTSGHANGASTLSSLLGPLALCPTCHFPEQIEHFPEPNSRLRRRCSGYPTCACPVFTSWLTPSPSLTRSLIGQPARRLRPLHSRWRPDQAVVPGHPTRWRHRPPHFLFPAHLRHPGPRPQGYLLRPNLSSRQHPAANSTLLAPGLAASPFLRHHPETGHWRVLL